MVISDTKKMVLIMTNILIEMDAISLTVKNKVATIARIRKVHTTLKQQSDEIFEIMGTKDGCHLTCRSLLGKVSNYKTEQTNEILTLSAELNVYKNHLEKVDNALAEAVQWSGVST